MQGDMVPTSSLPSFVHPSEIETEYVEIGGGTFGKVLRGKCRGKEVAIKVLHKPITNEKMLAAFRSEVEIMSKIFHPNICLYVPNVLIFRASFQHSHFSSLSLL
jgi:serine/threonine protein kinase